MSKKSSRSVSHCINIIAFKRYEDALRDRNISDQNAASFSLPDAIAREWKSSIVHDPSGRGMRAKHRAQGAIFILEMQTSIAAVALRSRIMLDPERDGSGQRVTTTSANFSSVHSRRAT
jgi:hypothetical protein